VVHFYITPNVCVGVYNRGFERNRRCETTAVHIDGPIFGLRERRGKETTVLAPLFAANRHLGKYRSRSSLFYYGVLGVVDDPRIHRGTPSVIFGLKFYTNRRRYYFLGGGKMGGAFAHIATSCTTSALSRSTTETKNHAFKAEFCGSHAKDTTSHFPKRKNITFLRLRREVA
ncbi:hypothetical protein M8C21_004374, partial [Ambrosia artemisiifolia]